MARNFKILAAGAVLALLLFGGKAHALDFSIEEVRSMGLGGALRSSAFSTSALYLNPGGIALAKLYHIEATYLYDRPFESHLVGAGVVDSITSMLGVGVAYFYRRLERSDVKMQVHDARLSLAIPILNIIGIGITGKYLRSSNDMKLDADIQRPPFGRELNSFSLDAGVQLRLGKHFGFGAVGYNLTKIDTPVAPMGLGLSASATVGDFLVIFDTLLDWSTYDRLAAKYMAGAEYFLIGHVPLRIGYSYNDGTKAHALHGGVGYISKVASIEAAVAGDLNKDITGEQDIRFMLSVKYFLN
jgi:opacity protein-like surface antigen